MRYPNKGKGQPSRTVELSFLKTDLFERSTTWFMVSAEAT